MLPRQSTLHVDFVIITLFDEVQNVKLIFVSQEGTLLCGVKGGSQCILGFSRTIFSRKVAFARERTLS